MKPPRIALLGEYTPTFPPHVATQAAIRHSCACTGAEVHAEWVATSTIDADLFERFSALWIAPGSPYRDLEKTLWAIRLARENGVPCFGTCGGFQHMILEYARNVLGFRDAQHAEYDPYASDLFISGLACTLAGRVMNLRLLPGSRVAEIYGATGAREQYYCNFGVNPERVALLREGPLVISGADQEGEVRVIELPLHPFYIGTLYVPQARSSGQRPHPLVNGFITAALQAQC
jgi:CTP synthase (UTP-ammonia lyase)